jgi:hypothetical protein
MSHTVGFLVYFGHRFDNHMALDCCEARHRQVNDARYSA